MTEANFQNEMNDLNVSTGDVVVGSVTKIEHDKIWITFGGKTEGEIRISEWSDIKLSNVEGAVAIGETIRAVVLAVGDEVSPPLLSRKKAVDDSVFTKLLDMMEHEEVFSVPILMTVKGGLVADIEGLRAFLPASLLDVKFVEDLASFAGQTIDVVVSELDVEHRRVILSRKKVIEMLDQEQRKERLDEFHAGDQVDGRVARLTSFGAFVDIGGVDGLLHVSEMSWGRVNRPDEVVHVGDNVRVKILQVSPEEGKISLSLKTNETDPWHLVDKKFHVGDIVSGVVKRLSSFGAFVEISDGIEGLVHVSQIAGHRVAHPSDVLKPGDEVQVKILDIKPEEGRISLSIRDAQKLVEKKVVNNWEKKQDTESHGATLGELVGDVLRERFKM